MRLNLGIILSLIVMSFIFTGCNNDTNNNTNNDTEAIIDNKIDSNKIDYEWCREGGNFSMRSIDGNFNMVNNGIIKDGKYKGYCNMQYEINSSGEKGVINYYFDKEGNGFQVTNIDGKETEMSWNN